MGTEHSHGEDGLSGFLVFFFLSVLKSCCEGEKGQVCTYLRDVAHGCLEISRKDLASRRKAQRVRP